MSKSKVCEFSASTADSKCSCEKKQNFLVYEKSYKPSPNLKKQQVYTISPSVPQAKKIRVCSASDLKRICPPKLCECKPREGVKGIMKFVGFGVKGLIASAIIYGTYEMGIWGDSDNSEDLFRELCGTASPIFCSKPSTMQVNNEGEVCEIQEELATCPKAEKGVCCSKSPSISDGMNTLKSFWNCGILAVFDIVANAPERIMCTYDGIAAKLQVSDEYRVKRCQKPKDDDEEDEKGAKDKKECKKPK